MAVAHGVALVAATSLEVLQDGHSYSALLQIAHMLHGQWTLNGHIFESVEDVSQ